MLFFEGLFLVFLAATLFAYVMTRSMRARVWVLLVASYVFYAAWDWRFCGLILGSTLLDFLVARRIPSARGSRRRVLIALSVFGNLGSLAVFKYLDFGIETLQYFLGSDLTLLHLTLPVGISFYTFQSMSYTLDVHRGQIEPESSFSRFALFVSFFPQLVAGPIIRASVFLPQIESALGRFRHGAVWVAPLFVLGLVKKVVIADNIAPLISPVFASPELFGAVDVTIAALAFSVQIYCDFSGYTDMAIALGLLFGFRFPINFRSPMLATGPQDFWRRWHVSLSTWLRDYLFIPLSGTHRRPARVTLALLATMVIGGLWHGAGTTYLIWGSYHGLLLLGQRLLRGGFPSLARRLCLVGILLFVPLRLLGWLVFRSGSLDSLVELLAALVRTGPATIFSPPIFFAISFVAAEQLLAEWARRCNFDWNRHPYLIYALAGIGLLAATVLKPETVEPFIYFQF
jgi:alginate O-acetyltransferase complex protein AlgI